MDARELLADLMTLTAKGDKPRLWSDTSKPIGHSLQRMRRLDSAQRLQDWERLLDAQPLNFISYRIADGSRPAFEQARKLLVAGKKVFWDRWCLPRRLAERREIVSDTTLDRHLMQQLLQASIVWGIESPLYQEQDAYAQKECTAARQLGIYTPVAPATIRRADLLAIRSSSALVVTSTESAQDTGTSRQPCQAKPTHGSSKQDPPRPEA